MASDKRAVAAGPKPRVQRIDRRQMVLRPIEVERWIEADHAARAIWELVGQQDLSGFYAPIKAVEGTAGREPVDPRLLISLWVYAQSQDQFGAGDRAALPGLRSGLWLADWIDRD